MMTMFFNNSSIRIDLKCAWIRGTSICTSTRYLMDIMSRTVFAFNCLKVTQRNYYGEGMSGTMKVFAPDNIYWPRFLYLCWIVSILISFFSSFLNSSSFLDSSEAISGSSTRFQNRVAVFISHADMICYWMQAVFQIFSTLNTNTIIIAFKTS